MNICQMELLKYSDGIKILRDSDIIEVIKVCSQANQGTIDDLVRGLEKDIPFISKTHDYIPPSKPYVRIIRNGETLPTRNEKIPKLSDKSAAYVIIDDYYESGYNLENCMKMMVGQEINEENIWLLTYLRQDKFLDYARKFLDTNLDK